MAKTSRNPFNPARWLTSNVSSDATLNLKLTGYCIFATASSTLNLNVNFSSAGAYFKIIIKEDTSADLTVTLPSANMVMVSDGGSASLVEGSGNTITFPTGTAAGSYIDLICDGSTWYAQGMHQSSGGAATITIV